jgi:hypothetical protein
MNSTEQWPDGMGLPSLGDAEFGPSGRDPRYADGRWLGAALIAIAGGILVGVVVPLKILAVVFYAAFGFGLIAAVIVAWRPVVRLPRFHWNEAWTAPVLLIALPVVAFAVLFVLTLLNWMGEI